MLPEGVRSCCGGDMPPRLQLLLKREAQRGSLRSVPLRAAPASAGQAAREDLRTAEWTTWAETGQALCPQGQDTSGCRQLVPQTSLRAELPPWGCDWSVRALAVVLAVGLNQSPEARSRLLWEM